MIYNREREGKEKRQRREDACIELQFLVIIRKKRHAEEKTENRVQAR